MPELTLLIIKTTTLVTFVLELAIGITHIAISFQITNDSFGVKGYNECFGGTPNFTGTYKRDLQEFPYMEGKFMGSFRIFVIFLTLFILFLGVLLIFMQIFKQLYKEGQESVTSSSYI